MFDTWVLTRVEAERVEGEEVIEGENLHITEILRFKHLKIELHDEDD